MRKTNLACCLTAFLALLSLALSAQTTTNLQLWLKPEGLTNTVAASPISFWTDSSSAGYNATNPLVGRQPTLVSGALNGFPAAHFTGDGVGAANNYLQSPLPYNATTNPFTAIVVYRSQFVGTRDTLLHQAGGNPILYVAASGGTHTNLISNASSQLVSNSVDYVSNTWEIATVVEDASNLKLYKNGALVGSTAINFSFATATSGGGWVVGARQNKTAFGLNGDIAEILVYTNALNSSERAVTENYLATKYNLPASVTLLTDNYNTVSDPAGINDDLNQRQTGLVAPQTYFSGGGPVNITGGKINLDNSSPSGGYEFYYATPDVNVLPYESGATLQIGFDIVNLTGAYVNNANDCWASFTLSQYTTPGGPVTDWGMLIRTNGTGAIFGWPGGSLSISGISVTPTNNYHVDMTIANGSVHLFVNGVDQGTSVILCPLTFGQSRMSFGIGTDNNGAVSAGIDNLVVTRSSTSSSTLPSSLKLADNFNSADSLDINADLSRQTGPAATAAWITNGNLNSVLSINANRLLMTNSPGGGVAIGMAASSLDFRQWEHLNSFLMSFTVTATNDATSNDSWVAFRLRDNAPSHFVADADGGGTGVNFFPGDGRWYMWQSFLGATNASGVVANGAVPVASSYDFQIEVVTNVMTIKINGYQLAAGCGTGSYSLPAYQAANYVTLHCFAQSPATAAYAAFDNFQFKSLDPGFSVAAPTIINPAYANSAFKFSLNSVNPIFYAVDSRTSLTSGNWNYIGGVVGTGGVVSYTNNPATSNPQFYRLRVP